MTIPVKRGAQTRDIVELLRNCPDNTTLLFETGDYDFTADGTFRTYLCPVCNRSGDKNVVFFAFGKKHLTIDGQGSRFIFHDRLFPFAFLHCEDITLKNFSMAFSFMRYCAAEAVPAEDGLFLAIDPAAYSYDTNQDGNLIFTVGQDSISTAEKKFFLQQGDTKCYLGAGKRYYVPKSLPAGFMETSAEAREGGIFLKYLPENTQTPFKAGRLIISYDEDRINDNFFFDSCKNVKMEYVSLFRGAGMGVVSQLCKNVELSHLTFKAGEDGSEIFSTTADGLFFTQNSGLCYIHDCDIRSTMDDAVSIHNVYTRVEKILSETKVVLRLVHPSHTGFHPYFPGDILNVSDRVTQSEKGSCTVKTSAMGDDTSLITLECAEPVTDLLSVGDYLENHARSPRVVIRNNRFEDFPMIRLASAQPVYFGMNTVKNCIGLAVNDLLNGWYTYGKTENALIIGNTFRDCREAAVSCVSDRIKDSTSCHGDITVIRNRIINCKVGLRANHIKNLVWGNNSMDNVPTEEEIGGAVGLTRVGSRQLLMRRNAGPIYHTPMPEGFYAFTFHRDGDERMDMQTYIDGWFNVAPGWSMEGFWNFYKDERIPEDGFFLIRKNDGEIVAHSNVQLNEHKPGTATVHFVAVKEEYQGLRLGYAVSELVLNYVESHNIPVTYLTTDEFRIPAIKIYLKLGFRPVMWDSDMRRRWFPILRVLGCDEIYDENENFIHIDLNQEPECLA